MRKDRELEIMHELAEKVLPFSGAISEACDICAELDCLLCFAEATNQYNYRRPQMSEENVINIKQGRYGALSVDPAVLSELSRRRLFGSRHIYRHPLQEQTVDTFVPNDILVVGGAGIGSSPVVHGEGDDLMSEGSVRQGNSVVICTGANACGKVKKPRSLGSLQNLCMQCTHLTFFDGSRVSISNRCVSLAQIILFGIFFFLWTPT